MALLGGSSGSSAVPPPPAFFPIDIQTTENAAVKADQYSFDLSDLDYAKRFPGLVSTRNQEIDKAYNDITGPLDPELQRDFFSKGQSTALSAFGGGSDEANVTGTGSAGKNAIASSVAKDVTGFQDEARSNFDNLLAANPARGLGLSGQDAANLSIANTTNLSAASAQAVAAMYANNASQNAADQQQKQAVIGTVTSVISAIALAY